MRSLRIAFYLNFHNDSRRLFRAVTSIRRNYPDATVFVYDDWSSSWETELARVLASRLGSIQLIRRHRRHAGWASYDLVSYQLLSFARIAALGSWDYLFKMDTDTVLCSDCHEEVLRFGGDLVGNTDHVDPRTAVRTYFGPGLPDCSVLGGGYFIRLGEFPATLLRLWRTIPHGLRDHSGTVQEDQSISALCWRSGGQITRSELLGGVRFAGRPLSVPPGGFAVHPVKDATDYAELFGESPAPALATPRAYGEVLAPAHEAATVPGLDTKRE